MSKRIKRVLISLLCTAIVATAGCASTTQTAAPSERTMQIREIRQDGTVLVRNHTVDVPRASRNNQGWICKVVHILHAGLAISANPSLAAVYIAEQLE